ncbi:MFS transporter [Nocardioides rubriscoriae]|uniref:MFS transporter n=1 Tax=Nocardioides rubriscoriae TaxID=642762 RepID=UPI0014786F9A|nr:MFS transporter [Nocardioides rubriscoriae]
MGHRLLPRTGARRDRSLDLPGQVLAALALALLVLAISEADDRGWTSATAASLVVGAACCAALFLVRESRCAEPMLPLGFFRVPLFSFGALATLAVGWVLTSHSFFLSQFFQDVQGVGPLTSGLRTLPTTVGIFALAPVAGRLAARFDYRTPVASGAVLAGTGVLSLTLVEPGTRYLALVVPLGLVGTGFGLMLSPLVGAAVSSVPAPDAGVAGAANNVARQVGGTLGIAVLSALVAARLGSDPRPATPSGVAAAADAFTSALHLVFLVNGLLLLATAAIVALCLRRTVPRDDSPAAPAAPAARAARAAVAPEPPLQHREGTPPGRPTGRATTPRER